MANRRAEPEVAIAPASGAPARRAPASLTVPAQPVEEANDADLVQRIVAGDQRAEAELYRRFAPVIARTVERLLRSRQESQDVLHDTFVILLEGIGRLREPEALRAWLLQVAVSQVHRRFRRRRLRRMLGLEEPDADARLDQLAAKGTPPDLVAELGLLDRTLERVAPNERTAWMLRRIEGYSLEEIAHACRCSLATAKRRIALVDERVANHLELGGSNDV